MSRADVCIGGGITFKTEAEFETAFIAELQKKGWEDEIIHRPTEAELLANWAEILFDNNRGRDRLNDVPLTFTKMDHIIEQIIDLKTPLKLKGFINEKTVAIKRRITSTWADAHKFTRPCGG